VIIGGDPGSGSTGSGGGFPDSPTGSPGEIGAIARALVGAGDDFENLESGLRSASATLAEDWQGYAAGAYHACSDGLATVARGGAESFRDCARAVSGYSRALDHAQSEIRRLRVLYDAAMAAEASASSAGGGLENKLASAKKPAELTKLNDKITSDQTDAQNAAYSAGGYARQATAVLEAFKAAQSRYTQVLSGDRLTANGGPAPGSPFRPSEPAGAPGPWFGAPAFGGMPGDLPAAYGGVIPAGNPLSVSDQIPGYGIYYDATHGNLTSPGDLTNLIVAVASLGMGGPLEDLAARLAARVGIGAAGRAAIDEAGTSAFKQAMKDLLGRGLNKSLARANAGVAREEAIANETAAQAAARKTVAVGVVKALGQKGLLPTGVADAVKAWADGNGVYTGYAVAKLVSLRIALVRSGTTAGFQAARAVAGILKLMGQGR